MMNTTNDHVSTVVVSTSLLQFFATFNLLVCAQAINLCGLVANVMNILNFKKQGLHDSVNVTLTALAISDFGALFFQLAVNILFNPFWRYAEINFSSSTTLATLFFHPHGYFIRLSGFITAFAAFERCLCVVLPMRVKTIMTSKLAIAVNCVLSIALLLYLYPQFSVVYFAWVFIPALNRTVITSVFRDNFVEVMTITNIVEDFFLPYVTFIILAISTTVIVIQLRVQAKWRQSVSGFYKLSSKTELSSKDKKAVVLLTVISFMYITLLTPQCIIITIVGFIQDMKVEGPLWDVTLLVLSFTSLLESFGCSVNFIVYYNMSTRYREIIQTWFPSLLTGIN